MTTKSLFHTIKTHSDKQELAVRPFGRPQRHASLPVELWACDCALTTQKSGQRELNDMVMLFMNEL